jgi:hypothetical protein
MDASFQIFTYTQQTHYHVLIRPYNVLIRLV